MDIPTSEVGNTLATTRKGDHKVHKGYVVALEGGDAIECCQWCSKQDAFDIMTVMTSQCKASMLRTTFSISNLASTSKVKGSP
jgi:hypothetical protein